MGDGSGAGRGFIALCCDGVRAPAQQLLLVSMKLGEAREILGLGPDATPEDARIAYRKLALTEQPLRAIREQTPFE